jgi:hypothetical protein
VRLAGHAGFKQQRPCSSGHKVFVKGYCFAE